MTVYHVARSQDQGRMVLKVKKFFHFQNLFHPPFLEGAGK